MNELLAQAVQATKSGQVSVATKAELESLQRDGLVEIGPQEKPGSNKFQFRATESGVRAFESENGSGNGADGGPQGTGENTEPQPQQNTQQPQTASNVKGFEIENNVPVPEKARRSGPSGKYPFDALEVGQSFFIPATDDKPEPWKSLQSTVAAAQRRFAVEEGTRTDRNGKTVPNLKPTRIFRLDKDTKNGKEGARVWRTA